MSRFYFFGYSLFDFVPRCEVIARSDRYWARINQPTSWAWKIKRAVRKLLRSFVRRQLKPGLSQLRRAAGRVYGGFKTKARQFSKLSRK